MSGATNHKGPRNKPGREIAETPSRSVQGEIVEPQVGRDVLRLGAMGDVDISHLSPESRAALQERHALDMLDLEKRAKELNIDVQGLDHKLSSMTHHAAHANREGISSTIGDVYESSFGKTEVMIGNSKAAESGRLGRHMTDDNWGPLIIIAAIIGAAIVIGAIAS